MNSNARSTPGSAAMRQPGTPLRTRSPERANVWVVLAAGDEDQTAVGPWLSGVGEPCPPRTERLCARMAGRERGRLVRVDAGPSTGVGLGDVVVDVAWLERVVGVARARLAGHRRRRQIARARSQTPVQVVAVRPGRRRRRPGEVDSVVAVAGGAECRRRLQRVGGSAVAGVVRAVEVLGVAARRGQGDCGHHERNDDERRHDLTTDRRPPGGFRLTPVAGARAATDRTRRRSPSASPHDARPEDREHRQREPVPVFCPGERFADPRHDQSPDADDVVGLDDRRVDRRCSHRHAVLNAPDSVRSTIRWVTGPPESP